MIAMTHIEGHTPTNSEGDRTPHVSDDEEFINIFHDSDDDEYVYESEDTVVDVDDTEVDDTVSTLPNNYWSSLGVGNVLNPLPQRTQNHVHVTQSSVHTNMTSHGHGRGRGQTRVISDWFSNVGRMMGIQKKYSFKPKKKVSAYIFKNKKDMMKCDLTIDDITHQEQNNFDVQMKLDSVDYIQFSLGNGQNLSLSQHFAKWIINDYEPHMWREVGIHIYIMFGNEWNCISLQNAKVMIEQCLTIWKKIKKDVYIAFCEIVLEKEYSDDDHIPDNITTQIDRAMWSNNVIDLYQSKFITFRDWYKSKLLKLFDEKKSLKEMKKEQKEQKDKLFHHMFNFCGLYTMHNRADGVVNHVPGMA